MMDTVRPAAVAGSFYPGSAEALQHELARYLDGADARPVPGRIKAVIVPHAGYIYSAPIAAAAYARLRPLAGRVQRVVLFGPAHRVPVRGMAVPSVDAFETPLGRMRLDRAACLEASTLPGVEVSDRAHALEHSLEVQLPFLQTVLGDVELLPLVVGGADAAQVAEAMGRFWGGDDTLIVVSSDLSHYLPYAEAQRIDRASCDAVLALQPLHSHEQACGATPVNGLILAALEHHLTPHRLDLRNSGDTAGDRQRVVGYAAFAFTESAADETDALGGDALGEALLIRARNAIAHALGQATVAEPAHPDLAPPGATFVTLTQRGELRGCIGSLTAQRALAADVRANALAAAFHDPRFAPLSADEFARTRVEVSLLTAATPMAFADEADALRQLRPGVDGVIFACQGHRATFLPQVWEQLPTAVEFMSHLKRKAGLAADFWSPAVKLSRYEVKKWKENG